MRYIELDYIHNVVSIKRNGVKQEYRAITLSRAIFFVDLMQRSFFVPLKPLWCMASYIIKLKHLLEENSIPLP